MPCYHPVLGYRSIARNEKTGKRGISFSPGKAFTDMPIVIPCGKCYGCRLEKARQWAVRCMHEASLHEENCFLTLTYNDEHLPQDGSLVKRHLQLFFKNLRETLYRKDLKLADEYYAATGKTLIVERKELKYYACGEYGERNQRPHYHVCLFGYDFPDKTLEKALGQSYFTQRGYGFSGRGTYYYSEELAALWPYGFHVIGQLTFESAGYTARYVSKKIYGEPAAEHYQGRIPEFALMSRGGKKGHGLGYKWFEKYSGDIYPKDYFTMNGRKMRPAKYYDDLMAKQDPDKMVLIKAKREKEAKATDKGLIRKMEEEIYRKQVTKRLERKIE